MYILPNDYRSFLNNYHYSVKILFLVIRTLKINSFNNAQTYNVVLLTIVLMK